jgi:hypothetical protein
MTPEECASFLLSDCQDPELSAKAERENDADLAESLKDPVFKAKWDANLKEMADRLDAELLEKMRIAHRVETS